jgi:nucleotide-binding universal stress UspA family protein
MKPKRIMVPLDGSPLAESALPEAFDLAREGATLVLMRAAEAARLPSADPIEAQVRIVDEAEVYLADVAERARAAGAQGAETTVWYGAPAESIIEAADARGVDLIVMSSHGRSGLGRIVLGSVAETVLRGTTIPILLVRDRRAPVTGPAAAPAGVWEISRV